MSKVNVFTFERGEFYYIIGTEEQALDWVEWYRNLFHFHNSRPAVVTIINNGVGFIVRDGLGNYFDTADFDRALIRAWKMYRNLHKAK